MRSNFIRYGITFLFLFLFAASSFAQTGLKSVPDYKKVTRIETKKKTHHKYSRSRRSKPRLGWSLRVAYTEPFGDWSKLPYSSVDMFGGGIGFDVDLGSWVDRSTGFFIGIGGNRFDTDEYEKFVSQAEGQFLSSEASMLYLRAEIKGKFVGPNNVTPIIKGGLGYYLINGEESYRTDYHYFHIDYDDDLFNNNFGVNIGGELMIRNNQRGPAFIVSLDFIYVFDAIRSDHSFDDDRDGINMVKFGVGVGF